jgi:hypothetical protein
MRFMFIGQHLAVFVTAPRYPLPTGICPPLPWIVSKAIAGIHPALICIIMD